jgi:branched-chain amino acid transport system substrate-binding protein
MGVLRTLRVGIAAMVVAFGLVGYIAFPAPANAAGKGTLKIGMVCACSGPEASSIGITAQVFQAWGKYVNRLGGINGQKVQITVRDDSDNPTSSVTDAEQLISQDHVRVLVDNTNVDTGWAKYAQRHKVPVIGIITSSSEMYTNPDFFPEGQTQQSVNTAEAYAAKKVGGTKLALMYCAEAAVCAEGVAPLKTAAASLNVPLVYSTAITFDAPNYTAQCLAAKQAGADVLWIAQSVNATLAAGNSCATQGYTPLELDDDGGITAAVLGAPAFNNHIISVQPDVPFSVTSTRGMKNMYTQLRKLDPNALAPANLGAEVQQTWATGALIQRAAQLGGSASSADFFKGLYKMHNDTLGGMTPPLTYARGKAHPINCWFYLRVQNGKFTTPYGLHAVCHPPIS